MASTFQSNFHGPSHSPAHGISQRSAPGAIPILPIAAPPAGTFPPGTVIRVGSHKCSIERYLSEGHLFSLFGHILVILFGADFSLQVVSHMSILSKSIRLSTVPM